MLCFKIFFIIFKGKDGLPGNQGDSGEIGLKVERKFCPNILN